MNDKMIEEMAKDLEMVEKEAYSKIAKETQLYVKENHRYNSKEDYFLAHTKTIYELVAEALIKLGYTKNKIPEGSLVLTREEYNEIKQYQSCITKIEKAFDKVHNNAVKETAEKILKKGEEFYKMSYHKSNAIHRLVEWIKDTFGVEVEE